MKTERTDQKWQVFIHPFRLDDGRSKHLPDFLPASGFRWGGMPGSDVARLGRSKGPHDRRSLRFRRGRFFGQDLRANPRRILRLSRQRILGRVVRNVLQALASGSFQVRSCSKTTGDRRIIAGGSRAAALIHPGRLRAGGRSFFRQHRPAIRSWWRDGFIWQHLPARRRWGGRRLRRRFIEKFPPGGVAGSHRLLGNWNCFAVLLHPDRSVGTLESTSFGYSGNETGRW